MSQPLLWPCSDEVYANAIFGKAHFVSIEQLVEQEVKEGNIQAEEAQTFVVSRCTWGCVQHLSVARRLQVCGRP